MDYSSPFENKFGSDIPSNSELQTLIFIRSCGQDQIIPHNHTPISLQSGKSEPIMLNANTTKTCPSYSKIMPA